MKTLWLLAVLCCSTPVLAGTEAFAIGDTVISFPVPEGYCRPEGQALAGLQAIARVDTLNVTYVDLVPCASKSAPAYDHITIKTPKEVVGTKIPRVQLLAELKPTFDKPEFRSVIDQNLTTLKGNFSKEVGRTVDISGDFGARGIDDVCGYVAGTLVFTGPDGKPEPASGAASCMSSVADKFVAVNYYSSDPSAASILKLMRAARTLMLSMTGRTAN